MKFGELLRARRGERTLRDVATAMDATEHRVTSSALSAWERGQYLPKSRAQVVELERVLGCEGELTAALGMGEGDQPRIDVIERRLEALERAHRKLQRDLRAALAELRAGS